MKNLLLPMTTACVEYWFMLHCETLAPALTTVADKERTRHMLEQKVPGYKKAIRMQRSKYSQQLPKGSAKCTRVLGNLINDGLPTLEDTDERNSWLHQSSKTFTTVQEAITYLESLSSI